jgi:PAS domain S-box-containing protein
MADGNEEFALTASELLAIIADGVIITDAQGRILFFSPAAECMFGYSSEEVLHQSLDILIPERFRDGHRAKLTGFASETGTEHRLMSERREVTGLRKNGEEIPLDVSLSRQRVRDRTILTAVVRDVTERRRLEQQLSMQREALEKSERRMRTALQSGRMGVWEWDFKTNDREMDATSRHFLGLPETGHVSANNVFDRIHPDDLTDLHSALSRAIETGVGYEHEFRVRSDHGDRWIAGVGAVHCNENGEPERMIGVNFDVTSRWQAEEQRQLLMRELNHRMANEMAVIKSLVTLSASHSPNVDAFKRDIQDRLSAVSQRHKLLMEGGWNATDLDDLLRSELRPYTVSGTDALVIQGPQVMLSPNAATALGLVFHELVTNAAKYGALSTPEGRLEIRSHIDAHGGEEHLILEWTERGGPPVSPPTRKGFGSTVIERSLKGRLGADIELDYNPEGLGCRLDLPLSAVRATL